MHTKELAQTGAPLLGVTPASAYDRARRLVEAGVLPVGPRGRGITMTAVDIAKFLLSFAVSDDAKASPPLVERFWGLRPAFHAHTVSHFNELPFGPGIAMTIVELRRRSGWVPVIIEVNVTSETAILIVSHPTLGVSHISYGTPAPGPRWPRPIVMTRQLPAAVLVALAFDGPEHVPSDLAHLIRSPAEPVSAAA